MSTNNRAVMRVKNHLREGALLGKMHTTDGRKWFILPKGKKIRGSLEVADHVAELVTRERDVYPRRDGMWPGCDQTWGIGDEPECTAK